MDQRYSVMTSQCISIVVQSVAVDVICDKSQKRGEGQLSPGDVPHISAFSGQMSSMHLNGY